MDIHSGRKKIKSVKEMCQQRGAQNHMEAQRKTEAWIGLTSIIHLRKENRDDLYARKLLFKNSYNTMGHHHPRMKKGIVLMDQQGILSSS